MLVCEPAEEAPNEGRDDRDIAVAATLALLVVVADEELLAAAASGQIQSSLLRLQPLQIGLLQINHVSFGCITFRYKLIKVPLITLLLALPTGKAARPTADYGHRTHT